MEPIVTRSIQILTVGLATEYESYYTARHTRCCGVIYIIFFCFSRLCSCSVACANVSIIVCARTAGVCLRVFRSKRQTIQSHTHCAMCYGMCTCARTMSATETEWREKMKEKNAKSTV